MPDLSILALPVLIIAAAALAAAITRNHHVNRDNGRIAVLQHGLAVTRADRDQLLTVTADFVDAIEHRPDQLDKVAHQARQAIDGRWTP